MRIDAPTDAEIKAIEAELGAKLPHSFIAFLQAANGGSCDLYSFKVPLSEGEQTESISCGEIFSTHNNQLINEIKAEQESFREIPKGVLPFGTNGVDVVYLDLTIEGKGRVIAYLSERPAWTGRRQNNNYGFIELAPTFEAYIDGLQLDLEEIVQMFDGDQLFNVGDEMIVAWENFFDIGYPSWRSDGKLVHSFTSAIDRLNK